MAPGGVWEHLVSFCLRVRGVSSPIGGGAIEYTSLIVFKPFVLRILSLGAPSVIHADDLIYDIHRIITNQHADVIAILLITEP